MNLFKSVLSSTFKGRYFWVSYCVITALMVIAVGINAYVYYESSNNIGEWKSLWLSGGWNQLFIFIVGFSQVQLIKNKFGNLVWKNSNTFDKFYFYFIIQNLLYSLLILITLGIVQQFFAIIFYQLPIAYNVEVVKAFLGFFYTGLLISSLVWLVPSIWTIIVVYLLFQFQGIGMMLFNMKFPEYKWVNAFLPSSYVDKLGSIQAWEWYEYVLFFVFLFLTQMALIYRYNKIWKFN